ncbi:DUF4374 domain-containing protein [Pedobacter antarcticus]|uniref:DUF4374 domain-containing protein n=1 Tax=Pedobacter antarcticus TaxID=34086 RepID=UPI001C598CFE|nr:DUF4374 domain-containing protein [Pedobacter antarcticus]
MFTTIKNRGFILAALLAVAAGFSSCKKSDNGGGVDPEPGPKGEYAVLFTVGESDYLLSANSLTEGSISPKGSGVDVTNIFTWGENIIQKGKYFYHLDPNEGKFGKYVFENNKLSTIGEIPFSSFSYPYLGWHIWIDADQVMFGSRGGNNYAIVNTSTMKVVKTGEFDTKSIPAGQSRKIYSVIPRGNKLLIGFGLYDDVKKVNIEKSYLASVDFPSLENFKVTSDDTRSAPIGALRNGYFSQLTDKGNTFILTHPIALGANMPNMPTGFFRIKEGTDVIDPGYFFNVSALTNKDNQLGVCDLGNGKVILINAHDAATNVKEWNDWWYAAMWQYLVVDVNTQQIVKTLNFPPLLNSRSAVVHDGKAYIAVNDPKADAIYLWEYDPIADTLKKGLKVEGGSDNTPVIFKLN